jgi:hypothetical protein
VTTLTRIARVVTVGSALGAAARLYEEPHNPARFYHLVASTLMAFHAVSRHARYPQPINDHEAATAYLTLPVSLALYGCEHSASNGLLVAISAIWSLTTCLSRENESS